MEGTNHSTKLMVATVTVVGGDTDAPAAPHSTLPARSVCGHGPAAVRIHGDRSILIAINDGAVLPAGREAFLMGMSQTRRGCGAV